MITGTDAYIGLEAGDGGFNDIQSMRVLGECLARFDSKLAHLLAKLDDRFQSEVHYALRVSTSVYAALHELLQPGKR